MAKLNLAGEWKFKKVGDSQWLKASVPGSVFCDLMDNGLMEDPFYRDNEDKSRELTYNDYTYEHEFIVDKGMLQYYSVLLCCEWLDTLAEIKLNDTVIANTNNMHTQFIFFIMRIFYF